MIFNQVAKEAFTSADEGKVVSNGSLVSQTSATYTANDTYDTTLIDEVTVNVSGSGGYSIDDIVDGTEPSGAIVSNATSVRRNFSSYCTAITSITMPNATMVGQDAFSSNTSLTYAYFGGNNCTFGHYVVRYCSALKEVHIPRARSDFSFGGFGLSGCTALEVIDYGYAISLMFNSMSTCPLHTVIARKTGSVASLTANSLDSSTAFQNGGTGGTVYVPSALIDSYKTATNWSTYYAYGTMTFKAIEGSEYEL